MPPVLFRLRRRQNQPPYARSAANKISDKVDDACTTGFPAAQACL